MAAFTWASKVTDPHVAVAVVVSVLALIHALVSPYNIGAHLGRYIAYISHHTRHHQPDDV